MAEMGYTVSMQGLLATSFLLSFPFERAHFQRSSSLPLSPVLLGSGRPLSPGLGPCHPRNQTHIGSLSAFFFELEEEVVLGEEG